MTHTVRYAAWITGIAVASLLVPTPAAAVTNSPVGPDPRGSTIQVVEKPVPVDDTTNEAAQMMIAAALGAAIAAAAGRRRPRHRPARAGTNIIDITDTVRR